ncbi:MAG: DUF2007 domain-containing protein [Thermoflavifilum sp.]|nr:DUF2007 domain-containing protein [Thermoflavifilum sp.]
MEPGWIKIYSTTQSIQASLIQGMLKENGIESVILNRQDSEFLVGEVQLYVHQSDAAKAKELIESTQEND